MIRLFQEMTRIDWIIFCVGLLSYIPLHMGIRETKGKGQNFASYLLWTCLDAIQLVATIFTGGSYVILMAFTLGSCSVALALLKYNGVSLKILQRVLF